MENKSLFRNKEFAILVDSCCDVPDEYLSKYPIYVVPLIINYKNAAYKDRIDISPEKIYENMSKEVPTTSLPSYEDVNNAFENIIRDGYKKIIAIHISSNLSGTFNLIRLISEEYLQKGIQTFLFDTKNIAIGSGMYAMAAARYLEEGKSYEDTIQQIEKERGNSKLFFCVETLEYLRKGGRIGRVASMLGTVLGVKPIISCDENGTYYIAGKDRGMNKCVTKAIQMSKEFSDKVDQAEIIIMYSGQVSGIDKIKEKIEHLIPKSKVSINGQISPVLGVHVGPGLIGIAIYLKS